MSYTFTGIKNPLKNLYLYIYLYPYGMVHLLWWTFHSDGWLVSCVLQL